MVSPTDQTNDDLAEQQYLLYEELQQELQKAELDALSVHTEQDQNNQNNNINNVNNTTNPQQAATQINPTDLNHGKRNLKNQSQRV